MNCFDSNGKFVGYDTSVIGEPFENCCSSHWLHVKDGVTKGSF